MSNAKRPTKKPTKKKPPTKAVKTGRSGVQKSPPARSAAAVLRTLEERLPEPRTVPAQRFAAGPVPVPDIRQEGRYVYGIIQSKGPSLSAAWALGAPASWFTPSTMAISPPWSAAPRCSSSIPRAKTPWRMSTYRNRDEGYTIIPMSFGTVFRTDDDIREGLKSIYSSSRTC